jgi:multiple sugar transport system permease protein/cellobiose transport system permease protein
MLIINAPEKETLMLALLHFYPLDRKTSHRTELGVQAAGYCFAALPVLLVFWFGMKSYIRGIISGALKG